MINLFIIKKFKNIKKYNLINIKINNKKYI